MTGKGQFQPAGIARDLLRQTQTARPCDEQVARLQSRIEANERRYDISSSMIHQAIESGTLSETPEVCDWIMDVELLKRARSQSVRG